jgi:hypothetical protein
MVSRNVSAEPLAEIQNLLIFGGKAVNSKGPTINEPTKPDHFEKWNQKKLAQFILFKVEDGGLENLYERKVLAEAIHALKVKVGKSGLSSDECFVKIQELIRKKLTVG